MTYKQAQAFILAYLSRQGWSIKADLKVPHATSPDGEVRFWFKSQAVYFSTAPHSFQLARTLAYDLDIRKITPEAFLATYEPQVRRAKVGRESMRRELEERREVRRESDLPGGYEVYRQSNDYLYGWNWFQGERHGSGYSTKKRAIEAAKEDNDPVRRKEEEDYYRSRFQRPISVEPPPEISPLSEEKKAEQTILRWCRGPGKANGRPVMRQLRDGRLAVLDAERTREGVPIIYADGSTWVEVEKELPSISSSLIQKSMNRYGLTLEQAGFFESLPTEDVRSILGKVEKFREKHAWPNMLSPLVRGYWRDVLREYGMT